MTTDSTAERPVREERKPRVRQRRSFGNHAARIVGRLQARLLGERPHSEAISALARLRRGIGREPGFDYTLEEYVHVPNELAGVPSKSDTEAFDTEYAMHDSLCLYALHQQSRREPMHVAGQGLGLAIGELARKSSSPDGVRRRFAALGTATTYHETVYHLRSLTTMLREHQIPVDYGLLADDLHTLRLPGGRARMQAAWGREFFRSRPAESADTDTPDEE